MLVKDQLAVGVIMGEMRPVVVEPDHDPVGGYSSDFSLSDLKHFSSTSGLYITEDLYWM